jgi:threonine dehydrogenase-like Zn-dependent dehydrogenase
MPWERQSPDWRPKQTNPHCGTDFHFVRGTVPGMQGGTVLGHEGVGVIEEAAKGVRSIKAGYLNSFPPQSPCSGVQAHP